jgi:hypothetical protein
MRTVFSYVNMVRTATDVLVSRDIESIANHAGKGEGEGGGGCRSIEGSSSDNKNDCCNGNSNNNTNSNNNRSGKSDINSVGNSELYNESSAYSMDTQGSLNRGSYVGFQEFSSSSFSQKVFQKVLELSSVAEKIRKMEREATLSLIERLDGYGDIFRSLSSPSLCFALL